MKSGFVCADDFMLTKNISLGIINLIKKDKINAVSVMVIFKKNKTYAQILQKKIKKYHTIGLHIVLTDFTPLSKFQKISKFSSISDLIFNLTKGKIKMKEIENEIKAQILEFKKIFGYFPKYIDGHHHVHQLPLISKILIKIINEIYESKKPLVRNTNLKISLIFQNKVEILKSVLLSFVGLYFKKKLIRNNIPTNEYFFGVYDFRNQNDFKKNFFLFKKYKNKHSILMTHPSLPDKEIFKLDSLTSQRFLEYNLLMSNFS